MQPAVEHLAQLRHAKFGGGHLVRVRVCVRVRFRVWVRVRFRVGVRVGVRVS